MRAIKVVWLCILLSCCLSPWPGAPAQTLMQQPRLTATGVGKGQWLHLAGVLNYARLRPQEGKNPDDANSGIIYGKDHSFALTAPVGWVLDNSSGVRQGLYAVFYRKGSSWKDGIVVMYARAVQSQKPLEEVIQDDVKDFEGLSKDSTVKEAAPLPTRDDRTAMIRHFYDAANRNHEAVAYIREAKVVVMLVLSSRNEKEFENSLPDFASLVGSYYYLAPKK